MNKRVLVTGSTKGIGQGILKKFHEENWDVCVTGRNNQQVTKLENELNENRKNSAIGLGVDLGLKSDINKLFNFIKSAWGELDCLVLNIGSGSSPKGMDTSFESNHLSVKINYADVVNQFKVFSQLLGSIILIDSDGIKTLESIWLGVPKTNEYFFAICLENLMLSLEYFNVLLHTPIL